MAVWLAVHNIEWTSAQYVAASDAGEAADVVEPSEAQTAILLTTHFGATCIAHSCKI